MKITNIEGKYYIKNQNYYYKYSFATQWVENEHNATAFDNLEDAEYHLNLIPISATLGDPQ